MILDSINKPNDIKQIDSTEYDALALEIRKFLIEKVSKTGGHLASNLGVVELTMAIHLALDFPKDKVIWDVGHQSYVHKILSGRKSEFDNLRKFGHMSGFPKRSESECDVFDTGHSSTAISAGIGMAEADAIAGINSTIVSVVGDGALTGGLAFEALNNVSNLKRNFIVILNDNNMSISENVGGISAYLNNVRIGDTYNDLKSDVEKFLNKIPKVGNRLIRKIRSTKSKIKRIVIPGAFFEDMGVTYIGPIDGHNVERLLSVLSRAKRLDHPVLIHVYTKKGKGYSFAEKNPAKFHGIDPFDIKTGKIISAGGAETYTGAAAKALVKEAKKNKNICAITAAMPVGTGMIKFKESYPKRFFDVGIAEAHAVTFAAGLAAGGMKPYVAVYSSFLQRAFDQILHDVCIQNLPVTFLIDRSGIVGSDGETHQGIFDISYLSVIPNMTIIAPKNKDELERAISFSSTFNAPLAIRYGRGEAYTGMSEFSQPVEYGRSEMIYNGEKVAIIAVGNMVQVSKEAIGILKKNGINPTFVNARFVKPVDTDMLDNLLLRHEYIFTIEENEIAGGYGEAVTRYIKNKNSDMNIITIGIDDMFVPHGSVSILRKSLGIDAASIADRVIAEVK